MLTAMAEPKVKVTPTAPPNSASTVSGCIMSPRLRELAPAARGSQDAVPRNLAFTFYLSVVCRRKWEDYYEKMKGQILMDSHSYFGETHDVKPGKANVNNLAP